MSTPATRLTISAVCEELGISRNTLSDWRKDGRFPAGKRLPNGSVLFKAEDVAKFIDSLDAA
ncbi:MAG TPA: helix-turn-helix domain-containing protein [Acidimicrobiales bacterium]|jgi:predicted DNA-binding transcriptional regulator AlpA